MITSVISGGRSNIDFSKSIGGPASYYPTPVGLFDDVIKDQFTKVYYDFRCVYIFNDGDEILNNVKVEVADKQDSDSRVYIGLTTVPSYQSLYIVGLDSSGHFPAGGSLGGNLGLILTPYGESPVTVYAAWDSDPEVVVQNIENAINTVFDSVTCTMMYSNYYTPYPLPFYGTFNNLQFTVEFAADEKYRNQNRIELDTSGMTGATSYVWGNYVYWTGGPINAEAQMLDVPTTDPGYTYSYFTEYTFEAPFRPGDFFYVWIRRDIPIGAETFDNDGFTLRVSHT